MRKRRVAAIVTISLALVLIGSVTYAAGRKREERPPLRPEAVSDEEALKAELLAATEEQPKPAPQTRPERTVPQQEAAEDQVKG